MELLWLFDHRFCRDPNGVVFSPLHYNYPFLADRYLQEFDHMKILARIEDCPSISRDGRATEGQGVQVVSLGSWLGVSAFLRNMPSVSLRLNEYLDTASAVIIIGPGVLGSLAHRIATSKHRPYALEIVGDPYDALAPGSIRHPLRPLLRWWFSRDLRRQCRHASACHYVTGRSLQQRYPPSPASFATFYTDASMVEVAYASAARIVLPAKSKYSLVFVGTLAQLYKASDILIQSLAQVVRSGFDIELSILGDGKHRPELERLALDLGMQHRVHFLGMLPAGAGVREQLDKADLFVLPSRTEGMPRAMLEAMARALPCIGSAVGGIPELLPPEDLVPPGDVDSLANKIIEVLSDPQRMARMSKRNWRVSQEYRYDVVRSREMEFYRQVRIRTEQWLAKRQR